MGRLLLPPQQHNQEDEEWHPVVVGLQPVALIDHVARVDWSLLQAIPGERGGSLRVCVSFCPFIHPSLLLSTAPALFLYFY